MSDMYKRLKTEEIQKWDERLKIEVDDKKYWERVVEFILEDEGLDNDSGKSLLEFINSEESKFLFNKEILSQEEKRRRTKELLERLFLLRKEHREGEKPIDEIEPLNYEKEYYESKKTYGGNEEVYKDEFYRKAKKYIAFYYMLENKYKTISNKFEKKVCYQRYGKITTYGNYYNESAIYDLVIANVSRDSLYKRKPKNLCDKVKYEYGEDGALLIVTQYDKEENVHLRDVYFQSENFIYSFQYDEKGRIKEIGIRKYENEKIIHSEYARIHEWDNMFCREIHSEEYQYSRCELSEAFSENYYFPMYDRSAKRQIPGILTRYQYLFESNGEGYLKGYFSREWWGDRIKDQDREEVLLLLSEKKQSDTGREAGRWGRPNYFIE